MANNTGMKFGGRKKGTPNKSTAEIRALAQDYGEEAIRRLVSLMRQRDDRKVQFAAAKELLDRGYGRPKDAGSVERSDNEARSLSERMMRAIAMAKERVRHRDERETPPVIGPNGDLQIENKA